MTLLLWVIAFWGRTISLKLFGNKILVSFIFYFIFVKLSLHYTIPTILRIFSDYQFEKEDNVKLSDLSLIYLIEIFSWIFWILGFLLTRYIYIKESEAVNKTKFIYSNLPQSKFFFIILSVGFVVNMYYLVSLRPMNIFFSLFSQLFFFAGISVGPLLIIASKKVYNNYYFLLGLIVLFASILGIATRGAIVYTIFYVLFLIFYLFYSKKIVKNLTLGIIALIIIKVSFPFILGGRISINENGIFIVQQDFSDKQEGRSFLDEVEWRLGAPTRAGTAFLYLYEERPAGINPIKNSLLGFLPRSLNENKPHPSALDGNDPFSLGMYLIMGKLYGTETLMVEFPTGAHFYWEFGILGVIILSIISGFYIGLCLRFLSSKGLLAIPLLFAAFKPFGYVDPKIWVSDIAMQLYQLVIPAIFLFATYKYLTSLKAIFKKYVKAN
jgi:hypothetical protein